MRGPPPASLAQAPTVAAPAIGEGASQSQKHSAAEKAMSIYQDITFDGSRYVREKELCLFNKTQLLLAQDV
jgi:O-acetyl-ADP-ribose deacetylase (regulator of RNase III)